jgi:uncharacterized protein with ATP-grasp and redox domains
MKLHLDCIPCLVRQTLDATRHLELEAATARTVLRRTLELLPQLDWDLPPPVIARDIHRAIRELTGDPDPYLRKKISDTETALKLLPEVQEIVAASKHPFLTAVMFSIAGNAIDLGAKTTSDVDVHQVFRSALTKPVAKPALSRLERAVRDAGNVFFLSDNAGEIVFDRPLLDAIGREKVTVAVRGAPVINDATLDDAERAGITGRFRVISNGSDTPGAWLSDCSGPFVQRFEKADLVIAKGQGNYESLADHPRSVFFLFLVKCRTISTKLGISPGRYVIRETPSR